MATLVDTNILVDIAVRDPAWLRWSRGQLEKARKRGSVVINPIIYSEFSMRYGAIDEADLALPEDDFRRESLPWDAAYAASQAFLLYRCRGGRGETILPDFLIGAHAAIRGYAVLTRDPDGFRTYFPDIEVISPDTHP